MNHNKLPANALIDPQTPSAGLWTDWPANAYCGSISRSTRWKAKSNAPFSDL